MIRLCILVVKPGILLSSICICVMLPTATMIWLCTLVAKPGILLSSICICVMVTNCYNDKVVYFSG